MIGWRDYISRQFDIAWTDFLWKHRGGTTEIDSRFMHLIRALALVHCVDRGDDADLAEQVERLLVNPEPGVPVYQDLGCLDRAFIEELVGVPGHARPARGGAGLPRSLRLPRREGCLPAGSARTNCEPGRRPHAGRLGDVLRVVLVPSPVLQGSPRARRCADRSTTGYGS